jgi:hypothetical protein
MPDCDLCNQYVQRRKRFIIDDDSDQYLNNQYMVCYECYNNQCLNNPTDPVIQDMCNQMNYFLNMTDKELKRRSKKKSTIRSIKKSVKKYVPRFFKGVSNFLSNLDPRTVSALAKLVPDENFQKYVTTENIGLIKDLNQAIRKGDQNEINRDLYNISQNIQPYMK